jgi:hypothetical protein
MQGADANANWARGGGEMRQIAHADGVDRRAVRRLDGASEGA